MYWDTFDSNNDVTARRVIVILNDTRSHYIIDGKYFA